MCAANSSGQRIEILAGLLQTLTLKRCVAAYQAAATAFCMDDGLGQLAALPLHVHHIAATSDKTLDAAILPRRGQCGEEVEGEG